LAIDAEHAVPLGLTRTLKTTLPDSELLWVSARS
jgi:hypothetical protein